MKKIKSGDRVKVIAGKYRDTLSVIGKVSGDKVIVKGVNVVKKASKEGGFQEFEKPIHISNVMFYCGKCDTATRLSIKEKDWSKKRVCKNCGAEYL